MIRRFGKKSEAKAIFAVAHTLIVVIWHVLAVQTDHEELRLRRPLSTMIPVSLQSLEGLAARRHDQAPSTVDSSLHFGWCELQRRVIRSHPAGGRSLIVRSDRIQRHTQSASNERK